MFGRIGYTFSTMRSCWHVLMADKELMILPVISGFVSLAVMATFAVPMYMADFWMPPVEDAPPVQKIAYYGVLFVFYVVSFFIVTFFNAAVVGAAVMRLSGEDPSLSDALGSATRRLPQIFGWSLVAATVGLVLRMIEDRSEKVGQFVVGLIGFAWTLTTFLVVPVLVVEGVGPVEAFKRSAGLLKKTWGEQLGGNFAFGIVFGLATLCLFALAAAAFALGGQTAGFISLAIVIPAVLLLAVIQSTLQAIFQAAVYVYAAHGEVPDGFDQSTLTHAMQRR